MAKEIEFRKALLEPEEYFATPQEILSCVYYTSTQKRTLLEQWKNDINELLTAEQENMPNLSKNGGKKKDLTLIIAEIHKALAAL